MLPKGLMLGDGRPPKACWFSLGMLLKSVSVETEALLPPFSPVQVRLWPIGLPKLGPCIDEPDQIDLPDRAFELSPPARRGAFAD